MRKAECGMRNEERRRRNAECGMWNEERRMRNEETADDPGIIDTAFGL